LKKKTVMKKAVGCTAFIVIFLSCSDSSIKVKQLNKQQYSAVEAGSEVEDELDRALAAEIEKAEAEEKEKLENYTTLHFNEVEHNYGDVKQDTDNTTFFIVTNTGKKPLIIEGVDASCGCTTPEKPEKPISPGKSDKIKVVFHPKVGQVGEQNKTVTVTANTNPRITTLKIKAFVK
jgi:hypothetical protein